MLDNHSSQENQEEASLDEILDRSVNPGDHQNIINELQNMSNGQTPMQVDQVASTSGSGSQNRGQKRQRTEGAGRSSLPGTASGMAGGGMEQAVEPIPRPMYSPHTQIRHFKKVHRILTFGLAYKPVAIARTGTPAYSDVYMVTSLAHIPWEYPFMYLNPSEYSLLPAGARVKHVSCRVKAENVRIAFPTNSTENNLATLNQNKFLRVGIGLNQKVQSVNAQPGGFSAAQPMIATSITPFASNNYQNWVDNFYGVPNNDATDPDRFTTQTPRHQFGIPWVAQFYCCPVSQTNDPTNSGWEDFQSQLEEIKVDGPSGCIAEVNYSPSVGLLKAPIQSIWTGVPSTATPGTARNVPANTGAGNTQSRTIRTSIVNGLATGLTEVENDFSTQPLASNFSLIQPIEKNQRICAGITPEYFAKTQPTLHIGVMPVPALTTSAIDNVTNNSSFTDAQAYFEITCEMEVECAFPTRRALASIANTSMSNLLFQKAGSGEQDYGSSMIYGLFQTT
ncbi:VP1 [Burswood densovirus]